MAYLIIRKENDFGLVLKILVWQSAIIGFLIIIEYYTKFNIAEIFKYTAPNIDISQLQSKAFNILERNEMYRVIGIDSSAVQTAYRITVLFPLTVWYMMKGKLINYVPVLLLLTALVLTQTRAAYIVVIVEIILFSALIMRESVSINIKLWRLTISTFSFRLFISIIFLTGIISVYSLFSDNIINIAKNLVIDSVSKDSNISIQNDVRYIFIYNAFEKIKESPIIGYGSPTYSYYEVSNTGDLPAPLIYTLSGGIGMGILYMFLLYRLPYNIRKISKTKWITPQYKTTLLFISVALLGGCLVLMFNWAERHIYFMLFLFMLVQKDFALKIRRIKQINLVENAH